MRVEYTHMRMLPVHLLWLLIAVIPCSAWAQAWIAPGDPGLRRLVERLVDERTIDIPTLNWPIPRRDLETAIAAARVRKGPAPKNLEVPGYEFLTPTLIKIG